ncbi:MAG: cutinase [Mycobacterium sp.]|nr:cutinase [Mycobacterium sp.]
MRIGHLVRALAAATATAAALLGVPNNAALASAQPCPDVDVVFARGTNEPPGIGLTGEAFVAALRAQAGGKTVDVYPVNYPASVDFSTGVDGIRDASAHVLDMAATCPKTKMVLGGFSQGAAVMGFVTNDKVPDGVPDSIDPGDIPKPMSPQVASHVAAVALFGEPTPRFMHTIGQPPVNIGPLYAPKTIALCADGDVICSDQGDFAAHGTYPVTGLPNQAATFVASKL